MDGKIIITIGRESGSAGRMVGKKIADMLGVQCYDKELLTLAAKQSGLCEEIFETHDERPTKSFLYSMVMDTYSLGYNPGFVEMPMDQKVFLAQYNTIKDLANKGSCVIVGRCADYALQGNPDVVSVFVSADQEDKISHIMETYQLTAEKAKDFINKRDKKRSSYYNYYSNKKWGDTKSYDLCINRSRLGIDGTAEAIVEYAKIKKRLQKDGASQTATTPTTDTATNK